MVSDMDKPHPKRPTLNVLGGSLQSCCQHPKTGFYRDGLCSTGPMDRGSHVVCAEMTEAFLQFTLEQGNDLITPRPDWQFPGLKAGDRWCLCANRWVEAYEAGVAPPLFLESCHRNALLVIPMDILKRFGKEPIPA